MARIDGREVTIEAPVYDGYRITIPAREALLDAGNSIRPDGSGMGDGAPDGSRPPSTFRVRFEMYSITLRQPPAGIVECLIGHGAEQHRGLRMSDEPAYPGEWRDGQAVAWYERGQWVPCPRCAAALVWYEAGYVPGYRICLNGHHAQLSSNGRKASRA